MRKKALSRRVTAMLMAGLMTVGQVPVMAAETDAVTTESVIPEFDVVAEVAESEATASETAESEATVSEEAAAPAETEAASEAEVSEEAAPEEAAEETEEAKDYSEYSEIDFSAQRLLVDSTDEEGGEVLGEYDGVSLIQYDTEEETMEAYASYVEEGVHVDIDTAISVADDSFVDGEMTEIENPISALNDMIDEASETETKKDHPLIALIDTGITDSYIDRVSVIGDDAADNNGHGDQMASYILDQDAEAQILSIKALDENGRGTISSVYAAMQYAIESDAKIINLSISARATAENSVLGDLIRNAADKGIKVVGAAGNNGKDASDYVPGGVHEATIIGAATEDGEKQAKSNYGDTVDYYVVASTTSQAAALYTGMISSGKELTTENGVVSVTVEETEEAVEEGYSEFPLFGNGDVWDTMNDFTVQSTKGTTTEYTDGYSGTVRVEQWNEDGVYLDDVSGEDILAELRENVDSYLGRPYKLKYYDTATDSDGAYNCDGFVDHILIAAGGKRITVYTSNGTGQKGGVGWHNEIEGTGSSNHEGEKVKFTTIYADTEADLMKAMMDTSVSGLTPGSLVWFWDASVVSKNKPLDSSGMPNSTSDYHHVGFYIGTALDDVLYNADGSSKDAVEVAKGDANKFFHAGADPSDSHEEVHVTNLTGKVTSYVATFYPSTPPSVFKITKTSDNPSLTNGNSVYLLEGAVYGVYSDADCTNEIARLTTDASGQTEEIAISAGQYYVKEISAPAGYNLDTEVHAVTVPEGEVKNLEVSETPGNDPITILLKKKDAADTETAQGDGSLAGAEFTVKYYDTHMTSDPADSGMSPKYTWVFKTTMSERGNTRILFDEEHLVSGDLIIDENAGVAVIPYGTITVQETKAPKGYTINNSIFVADLTAASGSTVTFSNLSDGEVPETIIKGGVAVQKVDAESGKNVAEGKRSLAGAEFTIINASENDVVVDGTTYGAGEAVITITTDAEGKAATSTDALPYGTYVIKETKAPSGYLLNSEWANEGKTFEIRESGVLVNTDTNGNELVVTENPTRSDLKFTKVNGREETMAGIPFLITNVETGESHVIVSDENGVVDTTQNKGDNVNANDAAIEENGKGGYTVDETKLDPAAGIWFGEFSAVSKDKGALTQGSYLIEELQVEANAPTAAHKGYNLKSALIMVEGNDMLFNIGQNMWINRIPEIRTQALTTETNSKVLPAADGINLKDTVVYNHLTEGREYTVIGKVVLAEDMSNVIAETELTFRATTDEESDSEQGTVTLLYEDVDTTGLAGKSLVCIVELYDRGNLIQVHDDMGDLFETLRVPVIGTTAQVNELDEAAVTNADGTYKDVEIVDIVSYENLFSEEELESLKESPILNEENPYDPSVDGTFILKGVLTDKETGEPLTNAEGEIYESWSEAFTAEGSGTQNVVFTVNASDFVVEGENTLEGKTVVVFETLYRAGSEEEATEDKIVTTHEDIDDERQDIRFPKGRTHATDGSMDRSAMTEEELAALNTAHADETNTDRHVVLASENMVVEDVFTYENLHANTEYTVTGTMQVVTERDENGNAIAWEEAKDDAGNVITAETTFTTPESEEDSVSGEAVVTFTFSGVSLAGKTLVAFESVTRDGKEVIVHASINDEAQTVDVPGVHTNAMDAATASKEGFAGKGYIIDTVTYENLEAGESYKISGTAMNQATGEAVSETISGTFVAGVDNQFVTKDGTVISTMDAVRAELVKELNAAAAEEAQPVENAESTKQEAASEAAPAESTTQEAESEETKTEETKVEETTEPENQEEVVADAERVSGTVYVVIPLDATALAGNSAVVFEKLFNMNDKLIGVHEDIEDEEQTVTYPSVKTVATVDGKHEAKVSKTTKLVDVVSFTNLTVGKEYTVTGVAMDKSTGKELLVDGKTVTATATFTPDVKDGTVELTFAFDSSALGGKTVVIFEEVTAKENGVVSKVGEHKDINDEDQSVKFTTSTSGKSTSDTNDLLLYGALIALLAALSITFAVVSRKKKRH